MCGVCPQLSMISSWQFFIEETKSFAYFMGIMVSFFPHITKVGAFMFGSLSVIGGEFFSASIVDMNAIFAFGCVILLIKPSIDSVVTFLDPVIISYAVFTVSCVGYSAAIE